MAGETTTTARRRRSAPRRDSQATHTTSTDAPNNQQQTQQAQPNGEQQSLREAMRQFVMRMLLMYVLYQYYLKPKGEQQQQQQQQQRATTTKEQLSPQQLREFVDSPATPFASLFGMPAAPTPRYFEIYLQYAWAPDTALQLRVFATLNEHMSFEEAASLDKDSAVWYADNLELNTKNANYLANNITLDVPLTVSAQNSSWYAHVFVVRDGLFDVPLGDLTEDMVEKNVLYYQHQLVTWRRVDLSKEGKSLLGDAKEKDEAEAEAEADESDQCEGEQCAAEDGAEDAVRVRYEHVWKPMMPIAVVTSGSALRLADLPPKAGRKFRVDTESHRDGDDEGRGERQLETHLHGHEPAAAGHDGGGVDCAQRAGGAGVQERHLALEEHQEHGGRVGAEHDVEDCDGGDHLPVPVGQ
ncbi:Cleft lip and palate transmembrane protein 1 (CLPTM1) [Gracilaria domingensis]|nr:Cleft lip and palate transmembrane protein 1 (CLPTM1) [Gracilaria domingensis]